MTLYGDIVQRKKKIAVIGLGYVGMPLAVSFAKHAEVIGFDISADKIEQYRSGKDPTDEVGDETISSTTVRFTSNESDLSDASFFIIAVPTPINPDKTPDLLPVIRASEVVGRYLSPGSIVVYESTVYPGVTEDVCRPILEQVSGLVCGKDFRIGYSPERINPGDKVHRLENIRKIVSGMDEDTLEEIANVYEMVIEAGVHRAPNIKVAEAAKVVENSQRDINIAFMNELAMVFDRMQISTADVLAAMQTKWNALPFRPGLVGGHCIGVDPYYFVYQAEKLDEFMQAHGGKIDHVINLEVGDDLLIFRLTGRRVCKQCGASFHVVNIPPKVEGICDKCGGELVQRADDTEETVKNRIAVYKEQTMPLIDYYTKADNISTLDGAAPLDECFAEIVKVLGE